MEVVKFLKKKNHYSDDHPRNRCSCSRDQINRFQTQPLARWFWTAAFFFFFLSWKGSRWSRADFLTAGGKATHRPREREGIRNGPGSEQITYLFVFVAKWLKPGGSQRQSWKLWLSVLWVITRKKSISLKSWQNAETHCGMKRAALLGTEAPVSPSWAETLFPWLYRSDFTYTRVTDFLFCFVFLWS